MTALGRVRVRRENSHDPIDGSVVRADLTVGVDGFLTRQATRLVTLAGVEHSFARGQQMLAELCGWQVDDEVIRRTTHAQAKRATSTRGERGEGEAFATGAGGAEVLVDAGQVNTLDGWRDVKVGLFLRRELGSPATPEGWDDRALPPPTARTVIAAVEECGDCGRRRRAEADRLGVTTAADVSVLGDGGEWIWNLAAEHLPQATGVLDIYHALGHLSEAVQAVWGPGTAATAGHVDTGRRALLAGGKAGLERWLGDLFADVPEGRSTDPLLGLAAYFAKHPTRVSYAERLAAGRSIGSGGIEGAIKQTVNLRLKRTGARWRVEHVGPRVELRAISHTDQWQALWAAA